MSGNDMVVGLAQCDRCHRFYDRDCQHEQCPHRPNGETNAPTVKRRWCEEHEALDWCWMEP